MGFATGGVGGVPCGHRDSDVPTLGTNVDTTPIDPRRLENGYTTGSIEAAIMKYGQRLSAANSQWSSSEMRERPAEVDDVHSEWVHLSRLVWRAVPR